MLATYPAGMNRVGAADEPFLGEEVEMCHEDLLVLAFLPYYFPRAAEALPGGYCQVVDAVIVAAVVPPFSWKVPTNQRKMTRMTNQIQLSLVDDYQ